MANAYSQVSIHAVFAVKGGKISLQQIGGTRYRATSPEQLTVFIKRLNH